MATAQLPPGDDDTDLIIDWPMAKVEIREKWATGSWETMDYLQVVEVNQTAAPTISNAILKYACGEIMREDKSDYDTYPAKDLIGYFIRIQYLPKSKDDKKTNPVTLFVGQVVDYGVASGGGDFADETFTALGIAHLLDKVTISGSYIGTPDKVYATRIDRDLVFNSRYTLGASQLGNRSIGKAARKEGSPLFAHVFDAGSATAPKDSVWSALDICNYLIKFFAPEDFKIELGGIAGDVTDGDGNVKRPGALSGLLPPRVNLAGMTLFEALNKMIDRRRGLGWLFRFIDDGDAEIKFEVFVFSVFDSAIPTGDGQTIPGNAVTVSLDQSKGNTEIFISELTTNRESINNVGTIIVEGEEILTCFTLSVSDGNLVKGWTTGEEGLYLNGAGATIADKDGMKLNDNARRAEALNRVFGTFVVPSTWDWKAGSGVPAQSGQGKGFENVNITVDNTGAIVRDKVGPIRPWGLRFAHQLPLLRPTEDEAGHATQEFMQPFVLLKWTSPGPDPTTRYVFAHDTGGATDMPAGHVRGLDTSLGIELSFSPPHRLALNHWGGAHISASAPVYDWTTMLATVAVRLDTRLSVRDTIRGRDPWKELRIRVPGAELWWVAPRTVIDIDKDGKLLRMQAGWEKDLIVRDDSPHLRRVLALAKAWYSKERRAVVLTSKKFEVKYAVGSFFTTVTKSSGIVLDINSVVSSRRFNFERGTVTVQTGYGELDFLGMREDLPQISG